jgi:hypothetical protein
MKQLGRSAKAQPIDCILGKRIVAGGMAPIMPPARKASYAAVAVAARRAPCIGPSSLRFSTAC